MDKNYAWKLLNDHSQLFNIKTTRNLTPKSTNHQHPFNLSACHIHLDYSGQHLTSETIALLIQLADACDLREKIIALMSGKIVNCSENLPALHTALRASADSTILVNQRNVMIDIHAARNKMKQIINKIRTNAWLGFTGKSVTDIVNIGIGGSDLGPRFALSALKEEISTNHFNYHFISDADPLSFKHAVEQLHPETTLFIVSSKSFTTQETIYNAKLAMEWIGSQKHIKQHFIAVTANPIKAKELGITTILPLWSWLGGRYSFCSAINLITAIAIGSEQFDQLLAGANSMDRHFQDADFTKNLPIIFALIGVWNNNFLHINNLLTWTYSSLLDNFLPYIQQLDMESNGKSIDNQGKAVHYSTGPIVWGGLGNQAQHSYYQLLCQGTHRVAADFISLDCNVGQIVNDICEAKKQILSFGWHEDHDPNGYIPGNTPINHLRIGNYSPFTIGALIALYEHKIYTQSVIWNINPFDQPGVESAKNIASHLIDNKSIIT